MFSYIIFRSLEISFRNYASSLPSTHCSVFLLTDPKPLIKHNNPYGHFSCDGENRVLVFEVLSLF